MSEDAQQRLFGTIAEALQGVPLEIVKRQIRHFCKAAPQNGAGVDKRLGIEIGDAAGQGCDEAVNIRRLSKG
jgi:catalase